MWAAAATLCIHLVWAESSETIMGRAEQGRAGLFLLKHFTWAFATME